MKKPNVKACAGCRRKAAEFDARGLCGECRARSDAGPDLTCAMLGRGERGPRVVGVDADGGEFGCCRLCHERYWAGEVQLKDGRWAEACCTVVEAIERRKLLRFTPFKKGAHAPVSMKPE